MAAAAPARGPAGLPSEWDASIRSLTRSLDEARHFRGSLLVVHGPPGVGKTRLIDGALAEANVSSRRVRRTFLEPGDAESPFKAVLSLARWAAKLEELAPALDAGSLVLTPFLRTLAVGPPLDAPSGTDPSLPADRSPRGREHERLVADLEFYKRGVEAWGEQSRFIHELGWMILDAAARRHIIWIVESAQYLDPHSLSVIRYLAGCLDENPLAIWLNVDTPPPGELPPAVAELATMPRSRSIPVPRLSHDGIREILGWKYPARAFPDGVVESLLEESRGLLLSVEQLTSDPDRLSSPPGGRRPDPADALRIGLSKVTALREPVRELALRLAVVGEEVSLPMAVRLGPGDEEAVRGGLGELVAAGILHEQEPGHYCFRLAALPAELEALLPAERRRALHREVAVALESSGQGIDDRLFDLAVHWRKAEAWDAAARSSLEAARFSSETFAPEGGLRYAERALEAARRLEPRLPALEAEALVEMGRALSDLGRLRDAVISLRESLELIGDSPASWSSRARALFYLGRTLSSLGEPAEAFSLVEEASRALDRVDDARSRLMLHQVIGVAFLMSARFADAVPHFRAQLDLAERLGDPREVSYAQKNLSATLLGLDPHDLDGWRLVGAALDHHTRTNNFAGLAAGYLNRSATELELRDVTGALADLERSRQAAELARAPLLIASATLQEAGVLLDRSEVARAAEVLRHLVPWMPAMEQLWARVSYALLQARVAEAQARSGEADRLYDEAGGLAESSGDEIAAWECRLRRAALARRAGAHDRAAELLAALPTLEEVRSRAPQLAELRASVDAPGV